MLLRSTASVAAALTLLLAEPLVDAAAELHLHPGVVACCVLSVAALFNWAILSLSFLVARRSAERVHKMLPRPTAPAAAAPTSLRSHFIALCLAMGALLHVETLVAAAAEFHLHPVVVAGSVLAVAALFNWETLSLSFVVARHGPAEREPNMLLRPTAPATSEVRSPHLACSAFLVLAALMSASWFVEPFAAAVTELQVPTAVTVVFVVFFAALFNASVHIFHSFFLPRSLPAAAGATVQSDGFEAIAAAVVGMGVAACIAAAGGSAYTNVEARS